MNQIEINKQQKTQKDTKLNPCNWCNPLIKITYCASHLVHPVRLVIKTNNPENPMLKKTAEYAEMRRNRLSPDEPDKER